MYWQTTLEWFCQKPIATNNGAFVSASIRYINAYDKCVYAQNYKSIDVVLNQEITIINLAVQDRIITLTTVPIYSAPSEVSIQPQPPLSAKFADNIDNALALDICVFTQPNRHDVNKSVISNLPSKLLLLDDINVKV